jgi:SAM-dependent methyltransferase
MNGSIEPSAGSTASAGRSDLDPESSGRASRVGWDRMADDYQSEHGAFLGDADLVWGPEGLREADLGLLGDVAGRCVLEVGCGAAQGARWLVAQGAQAYGVDVSHRQLQHARRLDEALGTRTPVVQTDAVGLPFTEGVFDLAFSAYGAVPFVADVAALHAEVARVLRPGGRWVFSVTHPIRWGFPDDPGPAGLTAQSSYWDETPYVERDASGTATYVEHHRTLGSDVRALRTAGFVLEDLVEPEWPDALTSTWGGWSPLRGRVLPGTAIYVCRLT